MKLHSSVLFVRDINQSKDFYSRVLNQVIRHDFGKNVIFESGLSIWEVSPAHIIGKQLDTCSKTNRFELYFESDGLEAVLEQLKQEGVEFLHEMHEEAWGQRTIRFFDGDAHLIEIGEPLLVFVQNMERRGMTIEQISEKSGIPSEQVSQLLLSDE